MGKVYQIVELVGTSNQGLEHAIDNAIQEAAKDYKGLGWFEVEEIRGFIDDKKSKFYQVRVRIGCNV